MSIETKINRAIIMRKEGHSIYWIACHIGVSQSRVEAILKEAGLTTKDKVRAPNLEEAQMERWRRALSF